MILRSSLNSWAKWLFFVGLTFGLHLLLGFYLHTLPVIPNLPLTVILLVGLLYGLERSLPLSIAYTLLQGYFLPFVWLLMPLLTYLAAPKKVKSEEKILLLLQLIALGYVAQILSAILYGLAIYGDWLIFWREALWQISLAPLLNLLFVPFLLPILRWVFPGQSSQYTSYYTH